MAQAAHFPATAALANRWASRPLEAVTKTTTKAVISPQSSVVRPFSAEQIFKLSFAIGPNKSFHAGGVNTLRGYPHDAYRGKSECLVDVENRVDLLRKRTLRMWRWSAFYAMQGVLGVESASLWDHEALVERSFHPGYYAGLHLLVAGVDRIRLEFGSNFAKFELETDLGILDKPDIQRFRAR